MVSDSSTMRRKWTVNSSLWQPERGCLRINSDHIIPLKFSTHLYSFASSAYFSLYSIREADMVIKKRAVGCKGGKVVGVMWRATANFMWSLPPFSNLNSNIFVSEYILILSSSSAIYLSVVRGSTPARSPKILKVSLSPSWRTNNASSLNLRL